MKIVSVRFVQLSILCCVLFSFLGCRTSSESEVKYETDQYSTQVYFNPTILNDETSKFNNLINNGIQLQLALWNKGYDPSGLAYEIASYFSRRQLEIWTIDNPEISSFLPATDVSIYRATGVPSGLVGDVVTALPGSFSGRIIRRAQKLVSPIIHKKGLSANVMIAGVEIGVDKLTHFFGVGSAYLDVYQESLKLSLEEEFPTLFENLSIEKQESLRNKAEKTAIKMGVDSEERYWGKQATGVFSNADLVANYQGFLLLRDIAEDRSQYIAWTSDNKPYLKSPIDLKNIVNSYWNEAINPNEYSDFLKPTVESSLYSYCTVYKAHPNKFVTVNEDELEERFKYAGMRNKKDRIKMRLDQVCERYNQMTSKKKKKYKQIKLKTAEHTDLQGVSGSTTGLRLKDDQQQIITDPEKIKSRLLSMGALPGCKKSIQSAIEEHEMIMALHAANSEKFSRELNGTLSDKMPVFNLNNPTALVCRPQEIQNSKIRNTVNISLKYCKDAQKKVSYFYFLGYENELVEKIEQIDESASALFEGKYSYISSPGFFEFNDLVSYVYRAIPVLCRWY
ncbi:MAG: hypothetical protein R3B45_11730 [Bdellovibrionota bacterium]